MKKKKNPEDFAGGVSSKEPACQCRRLGFDPLQGRFPWRRAWQPTPVFLPGESYGQRSLVGYSPWGLKESNTIKWLSTQKHKNHSLDRHTLVYLKWIAHKDLLYSTGNSDGCYVAHQLGGELGGEWIHVYVWLRPSAVHLEPSQHC